MNVTSYATTPKYLATVVLAASLSTPSYAAIGTPPRRTHQDPVISTPSAVSFGLTGEWSGVASTASSTAKSLTLASDAYLPAIRESYTSEFALFNSIIGNRLSKSDPDATWSSVSSVPLPIDPDVHSFIDALAAKVDKEILRQAIEAGTLALGARPTLEEIDDGVTVDFSGSGALVSLMLEAETCQLSSFSAFKEVSMRYDLTMPHSCNDLIASVWQQCRLASAAS